MYNLGSMEINYKVISKQGNILNKKTQLLPNNIIIKYIKPGIYLIKAFNSTNLIFTLESR